MTDYTRADEILDTFASLADTLVAGYDVVDLLQTLVEACARLTDVSAAGILLATQSGDLDVVASTSEASRLVEVMQLSANAGPCIESFLTGRVVSVPVVAETPGQWARFRDESLALGFNSVYAIPLRLRETTIGTLNLLRTSEGVLDDRDLRACQALADVATIGILHERALSESTILGQQLTNALNSRVTIEQAKGVISHQQQVSTDEAFHIIRQFARNNHRLLSEVAQSIVNRTLTL
jgi:transcriptional regulator with GAF, ATPase, and Fis domain